LFAVKDQATKKREEFVARRALLGSGIHKKNAQRKAMGKDVRYQIKDLESASMIEADDFFSGNFRVVTQPMLKPTV
jgi:hypothetical protein